MVDLGKIKQAVGLIIEAIGEDPTREGLVDTPSRVAAMYKEVFGGLYIDPAKECRAIFCEDYEEMVIVKDITFHSMCEHHFLPFFGKAHVIYIPCKGKIVGLSKLARALEIYARRPQLQERLTNQVADLLVDCLTPSGVMVVIEAEHMCMSMRGIRKPGTTTITTAVRGVFADDPAVRAEAMNVIHRNNNK